MQSLVQSFTALPNVHPALIHFPIVLWMIAFLFDIGTLSWRNERWLDKAAGVLYGLGLLAGWATYWAGKEASDLVGELPNQAELMLQGHSDWAFYTVILFSLLTLGRVGLTLTEWKASTTGHMPWRFGLLVLALVGQWCLFQTADRGGALVYRHGVAVSKQVVRSPVPKPRAGHNHHDAHPTPHTKAQGAPKQVSRPIDRLKRQPNGNLVWRPAPGDIAALGTLLNLTKEGPPNVIKARPPLAGQQGLAFQVNGRAILVFPKSHRDIRVRARIVLDTFQGSVGLAHHVRSGSRASYFVASTKGWAALYKKSATRRRRLDRKKLKLPGSSFVLSVSSVGQHLKGYLNGRTVVHGHSSPGAPGRAGLFFNGRGRLRILSVTITPVQRPRTKKRTHKGHSHKGHQH